MMRVRVDADLCEGNARCVAAAGTVFRLDDDDDRVVVVDPSPDEALRRAVERAARVCPRGAITIAEES